MQGLNKWLVIAACLIIGFAIGVFVHETFDVFGSIGLGSRRTALRAERDGYIAELEDRDKLFGELSDSYRERIESDAALFGTIIDEERDRATAAEEENRILRAGIQSNRIGQGKVREGLDSIGRLRGYVDRLSEQLR